VALKTRYAGRFKGKLLQRNKVIEGLVVDKVRILVILCLKDKLVRPRPLHHSLGGVGK
jgi:hypothetical protein